MRLLFRVCADGTAGVAEQVIGGEGGAGGSDREVRLPCVELTKPSALR